MDSYKVGQAPWEAESAGGSFPVGQAPWEAQQTTAAVEPPMSESIWSKIAGGAKAIGKDILGVEQNKSNSFIPSVLRQTIGSQGLAGVAQMPGRVIDAALHPNDSNNLTAGQALGTTLNAGLTAVSGGTGSLAKATGLTGAKGLAVRVGENAALGGAFQVGSNLANKAPVGQDVGLSSVIGGALPIGLTGLSAGKRALLGQAEPTAKALINSLIKPLQKDFAYGKDPAQGIIDEGIVANSFGELSNKVAEKRRLVGEQIGQLGQKLDQSGVTLNLTPALTPIDTAIGLAAKSNNQSLFHGLQNVKIALMHDLTVGADEKGVPSIVQGEARNLLGAGYNEAKQFLTDIAEHTRFTGNPSDDKALNMATKQAYGIARDIMNKGADSVSTQDGAEMRSLNDRYGNLLSAKNAINHRDIVLKRQNILNLADRFSIPLSVATSVATGILTGDWGKAGIILASELGTIGAVKGLGSTASMTRIAQFLSKLPADDRAGILNSTPALKNLYERMTGAPTPKEGAPKTKTLQYVEDYLKNPRLGLQIEDVSGGKASVPQEFKGFTDLSTKTLEKLKGRTTVSKTFIEDLSNQPDLKQAEREAIRAALADEPATVNVKDFADKVKMELLPLKFKNVGASKSAYSDVPNSSGRYEGINLPENLRGPVADYKEKLYESPISTSAGDTHFSGDSNNYFAHTRVEDLPVQKQATSEWTFSPQGEGKYKVWNQTTGKEVDKVFNSHADAVKYAKSIADDSSETRRVIELQSDLFQKGRLESETQTYGADINTRVPRADITPERVAEVAKLEPYRNTWQDRIVREEIKQAAKDGKTKLQFPTGETAMNIEGLVNREDKWVTLENEPVTGKNIKEGDLITYLTHEGTPHEDRRWLITKNNGDGTFDAVDSMNAENDIRFHDLLKKKDLLDDGRVPTLDELQPHLDKELETYLSKLSEHLSAQDAVNTNNPIYKFYEKELGRMLMNKHGAKLITDPQGVTWYEVPIKKEMSKLPVEAFGAGAALLGADQKDKKQP